MVIEEDVLIEWFNLTIAYERKGRRYLRSVRIFIHGEKSKWPMHGELLRTERRRLVEQEIVDNLPMIKNDLEKVYLKKGSKCEGVAVEIEPAVTSKHFEEGKCPHCGKPYRRLRAQLVPSFDEFRQHQPKPLIRREAQAFYNLVLGGVAVNQMYLDQNEKGQWQIFVLEEDKCLASRCDLRTFIMKRLGTKMPRTAPEHTDSCLKKANERTLRSDNFAK